MQLLPSDRDNFISINCKDSLLSLHYCYFLHYLDSNFLTVALSGAKSSALYLRSTPLASSFHNITENLVLCLNSAFRRCCKTLGHNKFVQNNISIFQYLGFK